MKINCLSLGLLSIAILAAGCGRKNDATSAITGDVRRLVIRIQPAVVRPFERRITVQGTIEARNYVHVAARADGNLNEIWVDEGSPVIAGETSLFQIDPSGRQDALTIAEHALAVAEASARMTKAGARKTALDYERFMRLHKDGKVSNSEYEAHEVMHEQSRAQVDLAEQQVKQAEAALSIAQKNLADAKSIAPISGVVSARTAEPGEQMRVGQVVLRIDDLSTVEAAAFLPAQYYADVIPGETKFRLTVQGREAGTNTVSYRSPTINPALRTFEIKGRVEAAGGIAVPGQMANLSLVFDTHSSVGVPATSVLVRKGKSIVFLVRDGKAILHEVQTGLQNDGWTEILSGLETGENIVTEGQTQLRDGDPVEVL